jgi:hypothetical protein
MSGLVNAHYASPATGLPIRSVKQRHFLGYCHPDNQWEVIFEKFRLLRPEFMGVIAETPGLNRGDRRMSGVYLDSFFNTLGSREARQSLIVDTCRPWPP